MLLSRNKIEIRSAIHHSPIHEKLFWFQFNQLEKVFFLVALLEDAGGYIILKMSNVMYI